MVSDGFRALAVRRVRLRRRCIRLRIRVRDCPASLCIKDVDPLFGKPNLERVPGEYRLPECAAGTRRIRPPTGRRGGSAEKSSVDAVERYLYDLRRDPHEQVDLVARSVVRTVADDLRGRLPAYVRVVGGEAPVLNRTRTATVRFEPSNGDGSLQATSLSYSWNLGTTGQVRSTARLRYAAAQTATIRYELRRSEVGATPYERFCECIIQ